MRAAATARDFFRADCAGRGVGGFFDHFEGAVPGVGGVVGAGAQHLGVGSRLCWPGEPGGFQPGGGVHA